MTHPPAEDNRSEKPAVPLVSDPAAQSDADDLDTESRTGEPSASSLVVRSLLGGVLMGLANLVPGISGGTMLVAAGVYTRFIDAIAEVVRLRFRRRSVVVLGCIVVAAAAAIVLLAGTVATLVFEHRWVMNSLFIGLTLGGLPVVWSLTREAERRHPALWALAVLALALMLAMAAQPATTGRSIGPVLFFIAGVLGASAMILPGLSGGYLLLLLGAYLPILNAISDGRDAAAAGDMSSLWSLCVSVFGPVALGVACGVAVVASLLKIALHRFPAPTYGALLGLLVGSVFGLWPFQQPREPRPGDVIRGVVLETAAQASEVERDDWPTDTYTPGAGRGVASVGLVLVGFGVTMGIARLGRTRKPAGARRAGPA